MSVETDEQDLPAELHATVEAAVGSNADPAIEQTADGYRLVLPDRTVVLDQRDGPEGTVAWEFSLLTDGAVVSKHGRYESVAELLGELRTVLSAPVEYTVCCDG